MRLSPDFNEFSPDDEMWRHFKPRSNRNLIITSVPFLGYFVAMTVLALSKGWWLLAVVFGGLYVRYVVLLCWQWQFNKFLARRSDGGSK